MARTVNGPGRASNLTRRADDGGPHWQRLSSSLLGVCTASPALRDLGLADTIHTSIARSTQHNSGAERSAKKSDVE